MTSLCGPLWVTLLALLCESIGARPLLPDSVRYLLHVSVVVWHDKAFFMMAQPPDDGVVPWWPRWMVQASERLDGLAARGASPAAALEMLGHAADSRGHGGYSGFASEILTELAEEIPQGMNTVASRAVTEDVNAWVLQTEESMLLEYLETMYPACCRTLWNHMSRGGCFADSLPVTQTMTLESVMDFHVLRQWNQVLNSFLPHAAVPRQGEPRWNMAAEAWAEECEVDLRQLQRDGYDVGAAANDLLARARSRDAPAYERVARDLLARIRQGLDGGEGQGWLGPPPGWSTSTEDKLYTLFVHLGGDSEGHAGPGSAGTHDDQMASENEEEADLMALMTAKVKKKWLKSRRPSRRRPREPSAPWRGHEDAERPEGVAVRRPRARGRRTRPTAWEDAPRNMIGVVLGRARDAKAVVPRSLRNPKRSRSRSVDHDPRRRHHLCRRSPMSGFPRMVLRIL